MITNSVYAYNAIIIEAVNITQNQKVVNMT